MSRREMVGRATVYLRANGEMLDKDVRDYGKRITDAFKDLEVNIDEARERRAKAAIKDIAEYMASDDIGKLFKGLSDKDLERKSKEFIKWIKHEEKLGRISAETSSDLRYKIDRDVKKRIAENAAAMAAASEKEINDLHAKALGINDRLDKAARKKAIADMIRAHTEALRMNARFDANADRERQRAAAKAAADMIKAHAEALRINAKLDADAEKERQRLFAESFDGQLDAATKRHTSRLKRELADAFRSGDFKKLIEVTGDFDEQIKTIRKQFNTLFTVSPDQEEKFIESMTSWSRDQRFKRAQSSLRDMYEQRIKIEEIFKHDDSFKNFSKDLRAIAEDGNLATRALHGLGRGSLTMEYHFRRANTIIDRTSNRFGRMFGRGSRSNILNAFGGLMQGLFNIATLPAKILAPATRIFSSLYSGFTLARQAGQGFFSSVRAGATGSMRALAGLARTGVGAVAGLLLLGKGLSLAASLLSMLAANAVTAAGALSYALAGAILPLGPAFVAATAGATTFFASINQSKKASKVLKSFTDQVKKDLRDAGDALASPLDRFLKVILPQTQNGIRLFGISNVKILDSFTKVFEKLSIKPPPIKIPKIELPKKVSVSKSLIDIPRIKALIDPEFKFGTKDITQAKKHFGKDIFFKPRIEGGEYVRLNSEIKRKIKKTKLEVDATPVDGWLGNFSKRLSHIWQNIGTGLGFGVSGLVKSFTPILPYAEKLTQNFSNLMERWDKWAGTKAGQNKIKGFMDDAWDAAEKLWGSLKNISGTIGNILGISQDEGGADFLAWLENATGRLEKWSESSGKEDLKQWFEDAKVFALDMKDALSDLSKAFDDLDTEQAREDIGNLAELLGKLGRGAGFLGQLADAAIAVANPMASLAYIVDISSGSFYNFYLKAKLALAQTTVEVLNFVLGAISAFNYLPGPIGDAARAASEGVVSTLRTARDQANQAIGGIQKEINFNTNADRVKAAIISMGITAKQYDGMQVNMFITTTRRDVYRVDRYGTLRRTSGGFKENAKGGIKIQPEIGLYGEAGPEAIVPLNRNLTQVDPSVRGISALLQGKVQPTVQAGKTVNVEAGAVVVQTAASDPSIVAAKVGGGMVSALAGAL